MRGFVRDTFNEALDRKFVLIFGVVALLALLLVFMSRGMNFQMRISTSGMESPTGIPTPTELYGFAFSGYMSGLVLIGLLCAGGIIPHMFSRGIAEFYLSKPMSRSNILWNRFVGLVVIHSGLIAVAGLIPLLAGFLVQQTFDGSLLFILVIELISFLIWLCIAAAAGVWFGSTAKVFMTIAAIWAMAAVLASREQLKMFFTSTFMANLLDVLYYIVPKNNAFTSISRNLVSGQPIESWLPVWSSLLFAVAMLFLAQWRLNRREF